MTSEQELADYRKHEREVLARMGISDTLAKKPVTMKEFSVALYDASAAIGKLSARIDAIEQADKYRGVHQRALAYPAGALVTHGGNLWVALGSVPKGVVPGMNADLWQLASKGAKPAKADR